MTDWMNVNAPSQERQNSVGAVAGSALVMVAGRPVFRGDFITEQEAYRMKNAGVGTVSKRWRLSLTTHPYTCRHAPAFVTPESRPATGTSTSVRQHSAHSRTWWRPRWGLRKRIRPYDKNPV
jgi:hypothetical protein